MKRHQRACIGAAFAVLTLVLAIPNASRADAAGPPPGVGRQDAGGGPRFGGPPPMFHVPPPEVLESLGLSDAQAAKIEKIRDDAVRATARTEADLTIAELDLRRAVESDKPDAAAVDAAIDRVAALRTTLFKARVASWIEFRSVLSASQRSKLRTLAPPGRPPRPH